jgi:hypothetical protein
MEREIDRGEENDRNRKRQKGMESKVEESWEKRKRKESKKGFN